MLLRDPFIPIIIPTERNIKDYKEKYSFERMWLISSSWDRKGGLNLESRVVRDWMDSHYSKLYSKEFDGVWIDLYTLEK
jgi:hypothetical protein